MSEAICLHETTVPITKTACVSEPASLSNNLNPKLTHFAHGQMSLQHDL